VICCRAHVSKNFLARAACLYIRGVGINIKMAYNTYLQIDSLEVVYDSDYLSYPEIQGWRTNKELKDVVIVIGTTLSANWNGTHTHKLDLQKFYIGPPDPDNYTPFEDLTEQQCKKFVTSTERYWSVMSILTGRVNDSMHAATQGLCALPWE